VIRAAGGVVVRDGSVLLVHRARYDDWSLPKGKLEPGETWEAAALREVHEETGVRGLLGEFLGESHYTVKGTPKTVRWWRMSTDDEAVPSNEVDAVRWVAVEEAKDALSYPHERQLLDALAKPFR
jgi:8-oxo-dGTP diphosphatase